MRKLLFFLSCIALFVITNLNIHAQTPAATPDLSGIKATLAAGEVTSINQAENKVSLKTSDGNIDAILSSTTGFKRIPGDKLDLSAAVASSLSEVSVGDKIIVTGKVAEDKKTIPAKNIYLLTKSDLAKRDATEKAMWRTKGVSGKVTSVDFKTQQITVAVLGTMGEQKVTITPKENVSYKRYAPDSVKFSDAQDSSFAEIKVGDQVRALGDKSEDGLNLKAEQVVSGAFKTVVGTITAIDTAKNEVTLKELSNNKIVTIVVNPNSQLKKFPTEMATMMAGRMQGQGGGFQPPQGGQNGQGGGNVVVMRPPQANQGGNGGQGQPNGGGQPGGMRRMGGGGANINDLFDNLPVTSISEMKVGDQIGVSSSSSITTDRLTAIKLISGVEPFIKIQQMMNAANAARNGQSAPTINIPGLDGGFGAP